MEVCHEASEFVMFGNYLKKAYIMVEIEQKLLVVGAYPRRVFDAITGAGDAGQYVLGPVNKIRIVDRYFDTQKLDLKRNHASLRVRQVDDQGPVINLKTSNGAADKELGEFHRDETELNPFDNNPITKIWERLRYLDSNIISNEFPADAMIDNMLGALGLQEIICTENHRTRRVLSRSGDGEQVAELLLDDVVFSHQGKQSGHFFELEVEAYQGQQSVLESVTTHLYQQFPAQLQPSRKSKYERGFEFLQINMDLRNEYKLRVDGEIDVIVGYLRDEGSFAGCTLSELQRRIQDTYFDTVDHRLRDDNCYLRLREAENRTELTFRQYAIGERSSQIIEQVQIKKSATIGALREIVRHLMNHDLLPSGSDVALDDVDQLEDGLQRLGLGTQLKTYMDRVIFSMADHGKHVANIKLDKVMFVNAQGTKSALYNEAEISTDEHSGRTDGIALIFANQFGLSLTYYPKWIVGETLLRTGDVPKPDKEDALRIIVRGDVNKSEPGRKQNHETVDQTDGATITPVLFMSADPTTASRIRAGEELREIQQKLQMARHRDRFRLDPRMAARPEDFSQALLDLSPEIVHFTGHGTVTGELCFEDPLGRIHPVRPKALCDLFGMFTNQVKCVILSACYAKRQAKAIARHVDYVIGMDGEFEDKKAIAFSVGFYQALGAGRTIEDAYELGRVMIKMYGFPEHPAPLLIRRQQTVARAELDGSKRPA